VVLDVLKSVHVLLARHLQARAFYKHEVGRFSQLLVVFPNAFHRKFLNELQKIQEIGNGENLL
jgi:hypothetical protein